MAYVFYEDKWVRYSNYVCFLAAFIVTPVVNSQTRAEKIDAIIAQQLPHATIGVLIKDAKSGKVIYSRNADKLLSPASGMKLFTAAAALYQLKSDFHFITTLTQKDQNYYIKFTGSPSFTQDNLTEILLSFKKNHISTIDGNIIIDSSQYQAPNYPSGISYDDLGWYYAAPDTAVILNENMASFDLMSGKELGKRADVKPKTMPGTLKLINEVTIVSREEEKEHCSLNLEIKPQNTIRVFGCIGKSKNPKLIELAIPDPILLAKQVVKNVLDQQGIVLKGKIMVGIAPSNARELIRFHSKNLDQLIVHMLQQSDNIYANSLTKKLGYLLTGKGTHKEGAYAIKKILSEHTHIDISQMELVDGEGTRYNLVTVEQIVTLLSDLYHDKDLQSILLNALPQAGISGTLKERMKKTILNKKVYAKTGSMHDISSLSGFLMNAREETYVFSILINGVNTPLGKAKTLEEEILLILNKSLA